MGHRFFFAGPAPKQPDTAVATQVVSLQRWARLIDSGNANATLEARLSGFAAQPDAGVVTVRFGRTRSELRKGLAQHTLQVGPITPKERSYTIILLDRVDAGIVPRGTRFALITIRARSWDGANNDGYVDLVSLHISPP